VPELVPELASTVRFAVLVGGFEPMDSDMCAALLQRGPGALKVRTLHVHGRGLHSSISSQLKRFL